MSIEQSIAMVFPGQGSQSVGMLAELSTQFSIVEETFAEASEVLGYNLWQLVQQGPEEKLNQTEYTQPALLAADVAVWRCWQTKEGLLPKVVAGHSLGEYSALVCAKSLDFNQAIYLVAQRGRYMQEAVAEGVGAMAAIVGLSDEEIQTLCQEVTTPNQIVSPANFNAIGQTVIAGHANAVDKVIVLSRAKKAKIAKRIAVSVPSHCILMQSAASKLAKDLKNVHINKPAFTVIHNFDISAHELAESIRLALIEQLVYPVRWVETIQKIANLGIQVVIECGPGKVLTGLNKRITEELITYPTADLAHFATAMNASRGVMLCP